MVSNQQKAFPRIGFGVENEDEGMSAGVIVKCTFAIVGFAFFSLEMSFAEWTPYHILKTKP